MSKTLPDRVKVLDGGFSTQLANYVGEKMNDDPLWTARFLSTNPAAVLSTHLDFLRAGSDMIQTNTYQASVTGFMKHLGITEAESLKLIRKAVDLAKEARELYCKEIQDNVSATNRSPLIVGSCGPYGAAMHDASEYTGVYSEQATTELIKAWHRPRIEVLVEAGVDLLALETIPNQREAHVLVDLLREFPDVKAWLSFSSSRDGKSIADGSNFKEVAIACYREALPGQLVAVGVNCLALHFVSPLLQGINEGQEGDPIPLVAYPNSGEQYSVELGWTKLMDCDPLEKYIQEWLNLGVRYIGGCCRTRAEDIVKIKAEVKCWEAARLM